MKIVRKAGRLANGWERGKGSVWHALMDGRYQAVCGTRPAIQWCDREGDTVTCPRCLKRLEERKGAS